MGFNDKSTGSGLDLALHGFHCRVRARKTFTGLSCGLLSISAQIVV